MLRTVPPTGHERLITDPGTAAIDLQALGQRLRKMEGLPESARIHAARIAEAGRAVFLAAEMVNDGHGTRELNQFYGQFLSASACKRDALGPFEGKRLVTPS